MWFIQRFIQCMVTSVLWDHEYKDRWWTQSDKDKETGSVTYSEEIHYWEQYWKRKSKAEERTGGKLRMKMLDGIMTQGHNTKLSYSELKLIAQDNGMASSPPEPADGRELEEERIRVWCKKFALCWESVADGERLHHSQHRVLHYAFRNLLIDGISV